jgi:hypothetical protein
MVLPTKSSTADLGFLKHVQDGFQNNSKCCINKCARTPANNIWLTMVMHVMSFSDRIIIDDRTWIHHYESESNRQSTEQKQPWSPCKERFKSQRSTGKLMLTVFWDSQGTILEHYQERGTTVDSARYGEMLAERLRPAIGSKRRGLLPKGAVLLHDRPRADNAAAHIAQGLRKLQSDATAHPPYSPDPPFLSTTCLVHSKRHWGAVDLPQTKEWRKWHTRGSLLSRERSLLRGCKEACVTLHQAHWNGDSIEKWCWYMLYICIEIKFISTLWIIIDSPTNTAVADAYTVSRLFCEIPNSNIKFIYKEVHGGWQHPLQIFLLALHAHSAICWNVD